MTKRILLVGGEQPLWSEFRARSSALESPWKSEFAKSGAEALGMLANSSFGAVVGDLELPDMSGLDFLDQIQRQYPRIVRVVLSDLEDIAQTVRCIGKGHHHLLKPCDAGAVLSVLERAVALRTWLPSVAAQDLIGRMRWVPSPPALYIRVLTEMQSPGATVDTIGALIAQDPAIAAKVLQLANSAVFGLQLQVLEPREAVSYLGFETTKALVLLAHTFASFDRPELAGFGLESLGEHAVLVGRLARCISRAESCGLAEMEQASAAGLLHDIGKLLLAANLPTRYGQALKLARQAQRELWEVEHEFFGTSHAELGALLLGIWGLPQSIVEAVAWHHQLPRADGMSFSPLTAVHVADVLAHECVPTLTPGAQANLDRLYLFNLGLESRVEVWRQLCQEEQGDLSAAPR